VYRTAASRAGEYPAGCPEPLETGSVSRIRLPRGHLIRSPCPPIGPTRRLVTAPDEILPEFCLPEGPAFRP
jgi:hypothetical protein